MAVGAHVAPWGKSQAYFEKTHEAFLTSAEYKGSMSTTTPSRKTLSDRFRKIIGDRKAANALTSRSSGIAEAFDPKEQLLEDMTLEMKEHGEQEREKKEQKTAGDKKILYAGAVMRNSAVKRQRRRSKSHSTDSRDRDASSDKEMEMLQKDMEARKVFEDTKVGIEKERLDMEKKRDARDAAHQEWCEKLECRRVAVDERRPELEEKRLADDLEKQESNKEADRLALEERKALITVLGAMASKLN